MEKHTFCYDAARETWAECRNPLFADENRNALPVVLVVDYRDRRTDECRTVTWCEEHHTYESIEHYTEDGLLTGAGCKKTGLIAHVGNTVYHEDARISDYHGSWGEDGKAWLRWQVGYRPQEKGVYLGHDAADVGFCWKTDAVTKETVNVPFVRTISHRCQTLRPAVYPAGTCPPKPQYVGSTPPAVAFRALSLLREAAKAIYGDLPPLVLPPDTESDDPPGQQETAARVEALLDRPLDMNIHFFRDFFGERFDTLFPGEQRDNFPTLCKELIMEPSDALREAYRENPVYFAARVLLPRLGVRKEGLLRKFRGLRCLFGEKPAGRHACLLLHLLMPKYEREWTALRFYCEWLGKSRSEEAMAEILLKMNTPWRGWTLRATDMFRLRFEIIPTELLAKIEREGMSAEVYESLALLDHDAASRQEALVYTEKERARECSVSGYNFRLIPSLRVFRQLSGMGKIDGDASEGAGLYVMERNGRYLAYILVKDDVVRWSRIRYNLTPPLAAKVKLALLFWRCRHGIILKFPKDTGNLPLLDREFVVGPVSVNEAWERMGIRELTELPKHETGRGYYLCLYRKLLEVPFLRARPLRFDENERKGLTRRLPSGRRIFDAAWVGEPEAQYVISLLYRDGNFFTGSAARAEAWRKSAYDNGWREVRPDRRDIRLDEPAVTH